PAGDGRDGIHAVQGNVVLVEAGKRPRWRIAHQPHVALDIRTAGIVRHAETRTFGRFVPERVVVCRHARLLAARRPHTLRKDWIAHGMFTVWAGPAPV